MLLLLSVFFYIAPFVSNTQSHSKPVYPVDMCKDNELITASITYWLGNGYTVRINKPLPAATSITVRLDSGGAIEFTDHGDARFTTEHDLVNNIFNFIIVKDVKAWFQFKVKGRYEPDHPPYVISLKINGEENCKEPDRTFFGRYLNQLGTVPFWSNAPDNFCGRRRINRQYTGLITSGTASKSGEWPWHTAIYRLKNSNLQYICGGTLISKLSVLTAAHCATVNNAPVNPDSLGVVLGKYKLIGNDDLATTQDKDVHEVIIHDNYKYKILDNDIAILKLGSEAFFNNYVQPACLWLDAAFDQLDSYEIKGMVVGWGIDQTSTLSNKLREAPMPIVPDIDCIRFEPVFYANVLNGKKFCAGFRNGTSACNGDSGGGLTVFVPDTKALSDYYKDRQIPGAWYVKGIVSVSLVRKQDSVCDPEAYTVFTDVAKFRSWILEKM